MRRQFPKWLRERRKAGDAMALLLDADRIAWACDMAENPAFHGADARTKGFGGQRIVDAYRAMSVGGWSQKIGSLLSLEPEELRKALPPLATKTINQKGAKAPWGPWGDPTFCEVDFVNLEGVGLVGTGKERIVAKPCPIRRMLDNVFEHVLIATADHTLSDAAVAYRPGRRDAVRSVIVGVQKAVKTGAQYWAKLDIKSFFPNLPWALIRRSLEHRGFPDEFIEKLMVLVQTPLVNERGQRVQPTRGTQAGVRISGILANLALSDLDDLVLRMLDQEHYWRYSDDLIILGKDRRRVEAMVRAIRSWMLKEDMALKGVGTGFSSESLVHHVSKKRVEVLGAEVNRKAEARPSAERLAAFVARLNHRKDFLAPPGETINGYSNYAEDMPKKGRYVFDDADYEQALDQFVNFWDPLNRGFIKSFLADLQGGASNPELRCGESTWLAVIPTTSVRPGVGTREANRPWSSTYSGMPESINPSPEDPRVGLDALARNQDHEGEDGARQEPGCTEGCDSNPVSVPTPQGFQPGEDRGCAEGRVFGTPQGWTPCSTERESDISVNGGGTTPSPGEEMLEAALPIHSEMDELVDELHHSFALSHSVPHGDRAEQGSAVSDREGQASPLRISDQVSRIQIRTRVLAEAQGVVGDVVGLGGRVLRSGPRRRRYPSAVLLLLLQEVDRASKSGARRLFVALDSSWLPKALLQRTRRFHAPGLFD